MFTNNKTSYYGNDKVLIEAACLSTDTKPTTGIANGSACIEMDTGKTFMFNEEDSEWEELPDSSGSGGGGGGSSDFITLFDGVVTVAVEEYGTYGIIETNYNVGGIPKGTTLKVTFNNIEYETSVDEGGNFGAPYDESIGGYDYSTYPFDGGIDGLTFIIGCATTGEYPIKIQAQEYVALLPMITIS